MKVHDPFSGRPRSLAEVYADGAASGGSLKEFLDEFYSESDPLKKYEMILEEPPLTDDPKRNAWVAACAAHLSRETIGPPPAWTTKPERYLRRAWFPSGMESLKATFIVESPAAFRERMIFVEADPLYTPRRDVPFGSGLVDEVAL